MDWTMIWELTQVGLMLLLAVGLGRLLLRVVDLETRLDTAQADNRQAVEDATTAGRRAGEDAARRALADLIRSERPAVLGAAPEVDRPATSVNTLRKAPQTAARPRRSPTPSPRPRKPATGGLTASGGGYAPFTDPGQTWTTGGGSSDSGSSSSGGDSGGGSC